MIDLGKLKITIDTGADQAKQELNELGNTAEKQENKFGKFSGALKKGALASVTAITAVTGALVGTALKAADAAGNIDDMAQRTGTTAEEFQKLAYAAKLSGMETETLEKALIKQQTAFADASSGNETMIASYEKLGINIAEVGTSSESFDLVISRLADMEDETQRNALANDIFGKSYAELAPLLNQGSEGINALKQQAVDLGSVMSNEAVEAGANFGDSLDSVKAATNGAFMEIGVLFLPILQKLLDWVLANMPEIKEVISTVLTGITKYLEIGAIAWGAFFDIMETIYNWIEPYFPVIQSIFETTFKGIGETVQSVTDIFWGIVDAIKAAIEWLKSFNKEDKRGDDFDFSQNVNKGTGRRTAFDGSHANGLDYVPFDNYRAILHEGEKVLTAKDNTDLSGKMGEMINAVKSLENTLVKKNMNVSIGKDTIGKTAIEYANEQTRLTGEFAFSL